MHLRRVGLPGLALLTVIALMAAAPSSPGDLASAAPVEAVTVSAPLEVPVSINEIAPGDSGSAGGLRVRYEGTVPAWIGLDAELRGSLAEGDTPIIVSISDGSNQYAARGTNQLLGLFAPGNEVNLAIRYSFPTGAGNPYQHASAMLMLLVHAVQSDQNSHYENGRATGPITWDGRAVRTEARANLAPNESDVASCVGEGCAPEAAQAQPVPEGVTSTAPATPAVTTPVVPNTCCECLVSLAWLWLLYALLLVLAMLAAFYLGWRLRERSFYHRVRVRRRPDPPQAR